MKSKLLKYLAKSDNLLSDFGIKKYDYIYEIEYKNIESKLKKNVLTFNAAIEMIDSFTKKSITKEIIYLRNDDVLNIHQEYIEKLKIERKNYASNCR